MSMQALTKATVTLLRPGRLAVPRTRVRRLSTKRMERPKLQDDFFGTDKRPIIVYDGVCNLCNGGVNLALDWDTKQQFRFAALQSTAGQELLQRCGRDPKDISSILLVTENEFFLKSEAILKIAQRLPTPVPLLTSLSFAMPKGLRDVLYDQVARNRYNLLGKRAECRMSDERSAQRFLS